MNHGGVLKGLVETAAERAVWSADDVGEDAPGRVDVHGDRQTVAAAGVDVGTSLDLSLPAGDRPRACEFWGRAAGHRRGRARASGFRPRVSLRLIGLQVCRGYPYPSNASQLQHELA